MSLIIRYLWNSFVQKKGRTILVIFSIAVSAALIFVNEGFKTTVAKMFYEADTRHAGNSDIRISTKDEVGAPESIDTKQLQPYHDKLVYANAFLLQNALYAPNVEDMYYYTIYGVDMKEFQQHNPFTLKEGSFQDWKGYKVVMGEAYADKYGFSVGDNVPLEMNGKTYQFTVAGIARQEGIYMRELADGGTLFAPRETIAQIFGMKPNLLYIKVKDKEQLPMLYEALCKTFTQDKVEYTVDYNIIKTETANYGLPFQMASIAVIFMSMFIIFTGFGLIANERLSSLGILRSLGLTRKRLRWILMIESTMVGALGGLIGCGLGIIVLTVIKKIYFKNNGTFTTGSSISFGWKEMLTAILAAALITLVSALWSIHKITKQQIKEIMLHRPEQRVMKSSKLWVLGIILLIVCALVPGYLSINMFNMILSYLLVTGALIGLIFLLPSIVGAVAEAAGRLGLSQECYLGIRNCKDNKAIINNLRMFAALIAIVAFMVTIFHTMSSSLNADWKKYILYDVRLTLRESDEDTLNKIKAVKGVKEAIAFCQNFDSEVADSNTFINMLYGIEDNHFFDMNVVGETDSTRKAINTLNNGKNIITTNIFKEKLGLKLGDTLRIRCGDRVEAFTITGFVDTNLGIGHVVYISGDNYRKFLGTGNYDCVMVQGNADPNTLKLNLKRKLSKNILSIETRAENKKANADKVESMFKSINVYTYIALAVGMLGMLNNMVAGFLERKQSLALFRCLGMSRKGISKMLLTEAVTVGLIGSPMGLITAFIMMNCIPQAVGVMWGKVIPKPALTEIVLISISGLIVMFLVSLLPLRSSNQVSIMKSMKYE